MNKQQPTDTDCFGRPITDGVIADVPPMSARPRSAPPVNYAKRLYHLMIGLLVLAAVTCIVVFGFVLPAKRESDRVQGNTDRLVACMTDGDC